MSSDTHGRSTALQAQAVRDACGDRAACGRDVRIWPMAHTASRELASQHGSSTAHEKEGHRERDRERDRGVCVRARDPTGSARCDARGVQLQVTIGRKECISCPRTHTSHNDHWLYWHRAWDPARAENALSVSRGRLRSSTYQRGRRIMGPAFEPTPSDSSPTACLRQGGELRSCEWADRSRGGCVSEAHQGRRV